MFHKPFNLRTIKIPYFHVMLRLMEVLWWVAVIKF